MHGHFVELTEVVNLFNTLRAGLAFKVHERCVIVGQALFILHVTEDVEKLLVEVLSVFEHLWGVVGQIAVSTTLAWLVGLVLLRSHSHDIFDTLFNYSTIDLINTEDKLE